MAVISPGINIQKLSKTADTAKRGVATAGKAMQNIAQGVFRRTKVKREIFTQTQMLRSRRVESERRKQIEDELEAPDNLNKRGGAFNLAQADTSKGFFERIIGFVGYLTAGWLMNNLPTLIGMGNEFIARLKKAGEILSGFFSDTIKLFTNFGNVMGALAQNIFTFDFFDTSHRLKSSFDQLNLTIGSLGSQIEEALGLVTTPLTEGKYSGENIPGFGTEQQGEGAYETQPPPDSAGVGGIHKQALDIIAKYEAAGAGYNAMNQGTIPDSKGQQPKATVGGKTSRDIIGKNLTDMTIGEVISRQNRNLTNDRGFIHAAGRYQIIGNTLPGAMKGAGLKLSDMFSPENQDKMAIYLLKTGGINKWEGPKKYATAQERTIIQQARQTPIDNRPTATTGGGKVIEYLTGDRTHPQYRKDHGGNVYHDHIAFDSQATRDAAMRFLIGKGWTIGSINTGKHATGSYHYSNQAFDVPFYPNQSKKGVTDDFKGETILSSKLREDLIAGGFAGPQLGAGVPSGAPAQISAPQQQSRYYPEGITPERRGQDIIIAQPPSQQNVIVSGGGESGGGGTTPATNFAMLNNFIKNKLLLDLAYL